MKKSEIANGLGPSEYLARSRRGLWIKGVRTDEAIDIYWKPRFEYDNTNVIIFDFNGEIQEKVHGSIIDWGEEWRLAGSIKMVDEMVVMSCLQHFDDFVNALMRHAVCLLTCGYGDSPEDVIGWFDKFGERKFVVEDEYLITGEHGEFREMKGFRVRVDRSEVGELSGIVAVRGAEFEFDLNDPEIFTSFMISTTPV